MNTRLALRDAHGPLNDLIGKLSGNSGEEWLRALKRTLRKQNPWGISACVLNVWKHSEVRPIDSELAKSLEKKEFFTGNTCHLTDEAGELLKVLEQEPAGTEVYGVDLVLLSPEDMGLPGVGNFTFEDIRARAEEFGLEYCPPGVAIGLWKQYVEHYKKEGSSGDFEEVYVATEPVLTSYNRRLSQSDCYRSG